MPRPAGTLRRRRRAAFMASALTLLFVLRAFGMHAHLAWSHSAELAGRGQARAPRIEPEHSHRHSHSDDHEHSLEDHLSDLLAQRAPNPVQVDLAPVELSLELELVDRESRRGPSCEHSRPRARLPGTPSLRGPPAV